MEFVADLHLHSRYSRAVSQDMILSTMATWAKRKGIDILTTGDWTHPLWFREIRGQLEESGEGIYRLKKTTDYSPQSTAKAVDGSRSTVDEKEPQFLLTVEVSSIYNQGGRLRRIHNLIFAPNFEIAEKINKELARRGVNLMSDGRPIMGLSSRDLIELVLGVDKRVLLVPCHAWTPWFSLYGANSGFDSIEECFGNYSKYIYAIETGLSSDPAMNWKIKELENRSILSFSDAHSPAKMAREATVFELPEVSYENIKKAIMNSKLDDRKWIMESSTSKMEGGKLINSQSSNIKNQPSTFDHLSSCRIAYTIEFYPEEGKYHFTGHRNCKVVQSKEESAKNGTKCPVCGRTLTVGVEHRVQELSVNQKTQQVSKPVGQIVRQSDKSEPPNHRNTEFSESSEKKDIVDNYGVTWIQHSSGNRPPYVSLVPLLEIIKEALNSSELSNKVKELYMQMTKSLGSELSILLRVPIENIEKAAGPRVAAGVKKVRERNIVVIPGYDGLYGVVKIWSEEKAGTIVAGVVQAKSEENKQLGLF